MTLEEAKKILSACERDELRDHAFGDREVYWSKDGKEVASGYFGGSCSAIGFTNFNENGLIVSLAEFKGKEAQELASCGASVKIERNDETGPDTYRDGACMPGLTLEGVKKEICTPHRDEQDEWDEWADADWA